YHTPQVRALAEAGADRITAVTVLDAAEGIGVVRAAQAVGMPVYVSFTVGEDGRLADGTALSDGIAAVDAATEGAPEAFLVNCAHPDEVAAGLKDLGEAPELSRIQGFRLNAAHHDDEGPGDPPETFARSLFQLRE